MADDGEKEEKEKPEPTISDSVYSEEVERRDREVTGLLGRKDKARALLVSLQNPPMAAKSIEIKVRNNNQ